MPLPAPTSAHGDKAINPEVTVLVNLEEISFISVAHAPTYQRGVFRSVVKLEHAISRFVEETNGIPNPSRGPPIPLTSSPAIKRGKENPLRAL
jgi:hypothetical protein